MGRVTIFFISQRMGDRDGLFIAKVRWPEGRKPCKGNEGVYFGDSCNWWGDMVTWLGGGLFPIFHTYPLNDLMMDTQLSVDFGWDFLLGEFLS